MELETTRLKLRQWRTEDRARFAEINAEPSVQRYLGAMTAAESDAYMARTEAHFAEHGFGYWALEHRESGALIGACGMTRVPFTAFFTPAVEIGWRLATAWQGKGLAREAAERVLAFGFETLKLERIVAFTVVTNTPSRRLMERLGMREIGEFDNPFLPEGHELRRHVVYEIVAPGLS